MKRAMILLTLCVLLCAICPAALAQQADSAAPATTVRAVGESTVELAPDAVALTFSVSAEGETVAVAHDGALASLASLRAALTGAGVADADILDAGCEVAANTTYRYAKLGEAQTTDGYTVTLHAIARVRDVDKATDAIDAAVLAGASSSYALTYESTQRGAAYDTALAEAAQDAMRKAALLAQASGLKLGALQSVTELHDDKADGADASSGLSPHGMMTVTATIEVCYLADE